MIRSVIAISMFICTRDQITGINSTDEPLPTVATLALSSFFHDSGTNGVAIPLQVLGDCPAWAQSMIDLYWGRSELDSPAIEHTYEGIKYHLLPPIFRFPRPILIREQYRIIERRIAGMFDMFNYDMKPGLLIAGTPGTGMSTVISRN